MEIRLSYSALSAYERCPLSYRYQYVDGLEIEPTPYLSLGRSLHSALEWLYDRDLPEPPALEELLSFLDSCWSSEGFAGSDEELSYLQRARSMLEDFYHKNVADFHIPAAVEQRFELTRDAYTLSGVIDRIDRLEDGSYEIIDYKTNKRLPQLHHLREDAQLPIYQLALQDAWGITPSKLTFYYLVANRKYTTRPLDQEGLERVNARLSHTVASISAGEFPATPNRLCPWCSFEDICTKRAPENSMLESYSRRYRAFIMRRDKLEAMIHDLEKEMCEKDIPYEELRDRDKSCND